MESRKVDLGIADLTAVLNSALRFLLLIFNGEAGNIPSSFLADRWYLVLLEGTES